MTYSKLDDRIYLRHPAQARGILGAAALAGSIIASPALAGETPLTPLYAGGITLSGPVYRNIFNYYGSTASGDLCAGLTTTTNPCPTTPYNPNVEILYVAVTSTNTALAYDKYLPGNFISGGKVPENPPVGATRDFPGSGGSFYGTGTGASWVPSGTATNFFPYISFTSGDPMKSSDVTAATALGFGAPIQVPSLAYSVVIDFAPAKVWTPKNVPPGTDFSGVNLSTNALCGIFTGAITDWSSHEFYAANKNSALGSGPITVVFRHDGAATTLLLANALLNQCGTTSHPISTHPVPDQWLVDNAIANAPPYLANTSFFINVFSASTSLATTAATASGTTLTFASVPASVTVNGLVKDTTSTNAIPAGTFVVSKTATTITLSNAVTGVLSGDTIIAGHLAANFYNNSAFSGQNGGVVTITGMQEAVDATPGAVGYLSTDYAPPSMTGNDPLGQPIAAAANIQSYASYSAGTTPKYFPPSSTHTNWIMASEKPPSSTHITPPNALPDADYAINWSIFNPTPTNPNAYPIGGFAYFELYSCYASAAERNALVGTTPGSLGLIRWFLGTETENAGIPNRLLTSEGFYPVPPVWAAAAKYLLVTNPVTRIGTFGVTRPKSACSGATKGAT